jgi:hypothetical protein
MKKNELSKLLYSFHLFLPFFVNPPLQTHKKASRIQSNNEKLSILSLDIIHYASFFLL